MKYATWSLNFSDSNYGTGPEYKIIELGFNATGAHSKDSNQVGEKILGYVYGEPLASELSNWSFSYLNQDEALEFCKAINPEARLLEDGTISVPTPAE
jgi:hypothetical protein